MDQIQRVTGDHHLPRRAGVHHDRPLTGHRRGFQTDGVVPDGSGAMLARFDDRVGDLAARMLNLPLGGAADEEVAACRLGGRFVHVIRQRQSAR